MPLAIPDKSVIDAVRLTDVVVATVFGSKLYVIKGGVRSSGAPLNSSAPISGVVAFLRSPSKSVVIPAIDTPPDSNSGLVLFR